MVYYKDHMGRSQDFGVGRDVATGAAAKLALRFTNGAYTYQYGNAGAPNPCFTYNDNDDHVNASDTFTNVNFTYYDINTTPWGQLESVISDNFQQAVVTRNRVSFTCAKKTIIRGNTKWYATIYYLTNTHATRTANGVIFFQGSDMDFNGDPNGDDCNYDNVNDTVYGYKPVPVPAENPSISYAGFSAFIPSSHHEVNNYATMWPDMDNLAGNLIDNAAYNGDASFAMQYNLGNMAPGAQQVVEIVWGFGNTLNGQAQQDMQNEINTGKSQLHDTGIMQIKNPSEGQVFQNSTGYVMITGTVVDYGLRDWSGLPVHINITGPAGFTPINTTFTNVTLTVPTAESTDVGYYFNISAVPPGMYTITMSTNLGSDFGITDQNQANDSKIIHIYVGGLSVSPQTQQVVNAGASGNINLTVSNTSGANDRFDISLAQSSMGWPTYLIDGASGVTIAADTTGAGTWNYVNAAYDTNSNGKPDVPVNNNSSYWLILRKFVPATALGGQLDTTGLTFTGITNTGLTATAQENTLSAYPAAATKWLWLHASQQSPATSPFSFTTITDTAATGTYTQVGFLTSQGWELSPPLYSQLRITQNIPVRLVLSTGGIALNAEAALFYTDGVSNSTLIGQATVNNINYADNAPTAVTFTVTVSSSITIPAGDKLVLMFYNLGNTGAAGTLISECTRTAARYKIRTYSFRYQLM